MLQLVIEVQNRVNTKSGGRELTVNEADRDKDEIEEWGRITK
jgi:hypothetical protein